ncbi:FmdC precursor [bacterium]|nr:FmdC precursor [bacterium]
MCKRSSVLIGMAMSLCASAQLSFPNAKKGISFYAKDTSAFMQFNARIQSQASYSDNFNGENPESNMLIRRMRLKFKGFVVDPRYEYKLELAMSNRDMGNRRDEAQVNNSPKLVLDAVFKYNFAPRHSIWFGQTKLPGNRERVISSQALQFVDRSAVNAFFNIDRDFGFWYWYKNKDFVVPYTASLALTRGEGRNITIDNVGGFSYTGRFEIYPFGQFNSKGDYFSADLEREQSPKLAIGTSYCMNINTDRSAGQLGNFVSDSTGPIYRDLNTLFIDAVFKYKGLSIQTEYAKRILSSPHPEFRSGDGFVIQSGYLFFRNYELALRYTDIELTNSGDTDDYTEYTLGISNYILDHKLKWQCDYSIVDGFSDRSQRFRFQVEIGI